MGDAAVELVYVAGPFSTNNRNVFLCPECDDDQVTGLDGAPTICTALWLHGQALQGDARVGSRACVCWVTDPYADDPEATNANRRFFFYRTLAILFGGAGQRVDLPACVKERIAELYGDSVIGFLPSAPLA